MARQHAYFQQFQRVALAVPAFAGLAMASGQADQTVSPACLLVSAAEKYAVRLLVDVIPAVWKASSGCGFNWASYSIVQTLVTGAHILGRVLGA